MTHLCTNYPELVEEGIYEDEQFLNGLVSKLKFTPPKKCIGKKETAELLSGKCGLSQRGYKALKAILKKQHVSLPDYCDVVDYLKELDVGQIVKSQCDCNKCMGASTDIVETLQLIIKHKGDPEFPSTAKQMALFKYLKDYDPATYSSLDSTKRTFFLRQTGDNFRAAARMPTEQVSFSVLNDKSVLNSPYGQYINCLWRGPENRDNFLLHVKAYLKDLDSIAKNGVVLTVNGRREHFNIIVFFVADIGL